MGDKDPPANCEVCGIDTAPYCNCCDLPTGPWEYYMVHNSLWQAAGMTTGFLCIGCLEYRIGRKLWWGDFTTAPVNDIDTELDTERLINRKLRMGPGNEDRTRTDQ
jgi:hypothetical protein